MQRCAWATLSSNPLMIQYHDREWGVPVHDNRKLFEFLILEGAQAGLTWQTVLTKREGYRKAFYNFHPQKVALMTQKDIKRLLKTPSIIRNRLKIEVTIHNAKRFLEVKKEFGSFNRYIWQFVAPRGARGDPERSRRVGGKPIKNKYRSFKEIPSITKESEMMSKDLKDRGFKFVGGTICYAFMQAVGMVNDHETHCFRYNEIATIYRKWHARQ